VAVIIKSRLPIIELGGEHEGIELRHRSRRPDDFTEGA
jgi:hypothetical protein